MKLYEKIVNKQEKLSLVGLGYVGMPIAVAFAQKGVEVIGFDLNRIRSICTIGASIPPTKWETTPFAILPWNLRQTPKS